MTRRHFVAISLVLRDVLDDPDTDRRTVLTVIRRLLPVFRWANSGFSTDTFLASCGTDRAEVLG